MDLTNPMHIATKSSKIDITLEKDTKSISQKISDHLSKGDVVFLYGEIGVGKSTFIKHRSDIIVKHINSGKTSNDILCLQCRFDIKYDKWSLVNKYMIGGINVTIEI